MVDDWILRDDEILRLEKVSVRYRVPQDRVISIKEYTIRSLRGGIQNHEFWALRDVDLHVQRGEFFGIIGPNGAGKSTLLKVVARVIAPTTGRIVQRGTVAPLLSFQAGFHFELTGRENVFLYSALLGFSPRETETRFEAIVDFAELWDFIDAPLRTYSSGMVTRLGFSVATASVPDILIVDEALSVGDAAFQDKSSARMRQFHAEGTTILFVTHSMNNVKELCQRVLWLQDGQAKGLGPAAEVVDRYLAG